MKIVLGIRRFALDQIFVILFFLLTGLFADLVCFRQTALRLESIFPIFFLWSYPKLKIAPCRYSGSAYTGNLVIAAHNYRTHFGLLEGLAPGAQVKFTDVEGNVFSYEIAEIVILEPTAIEELLSDEWNLTLFTCTYGGQARVAVRCRAIALK